ncbi:MAG: type III-A CRISPR-associated RAMP protein Csm5 [Chloroflexota bacterium]
MTVYDVTLQTLSPLHIGDGNELRQDFDFVFHDQHTYRLDEDAILEAKGDRLRPDARGHYPPPGLLLDERDFDNAGLFRYVLRGAPRSARTDARMKSFIKDPQQRPYIPGSSLKGALRTALAWTGWEEVQPRLERAAIGSSKSWAGQPLERKLFGPDPNRDLLRALHVSDLLLPEGAKAGQGILVVNAQVLTMRNAGSPIELEALPGDIAFHGSLTIDETLFGKMAEPILHFGNRRRWLDELATRAQAHSRARIRQLLEWFEQADPAYAALAKFYRQLGAAQLGAHQALLQLGWGSGWDGKTFWTRLQSDAALFEKLVSDFRMHKSTKDSPPRKAGDPFPRSKRAAMLVRDGVAQAVAPFGWVLLEMTKRK